MVHKNALLRIEAYSIMLTSFKYELKFWEMRLDVAEVVEEELNEIADIVLEYLIDDALVRWRCVLQSKWHHDPYICSPFCAECTLKLILL